MKLVILTHPVWFGSRSMPRFAQMISDGMRQRGHEVEVWTASQTLSRLGKPGTSTLKWLGYVDQFALYPRELKKSAESLSEDTLFVFTDHALASWLKSVVDRPHVIHCHDFLAQRSAMGFVDQNPVSWTGRQYQGMIRRGFRRGRNFISVSEKTKQDLHEFLITEPDLSEVVYNGLNGPFRVIEPHDARTLLAAELAPEDEGGFLIHVGGNQWYKHREGVIEIYEEYCRRAEDPLPIWLVGAEPSDRLRRAATRIPPNGNLRFLTGLSNEQVIAAYNLAKLLLFPSLAEGFGWPIAEAMACGTPVVTTEAAPMTEVGGDAAFYLRQRECGDEEWAREGARLIESVLAMPDSRREEVVELGIANARRFSTEDTLDRYEQVYSQVLADSMSPV